MSVITGQIALHIRLLLRGSGKQRPMRTSHDFQIVGSFFMLGFEKKFDFMYKTSCIFRIICFNLHIRLNVGTYIKNVKTK